MEPKRVTLVADELRGLQGGGIGTATSHLALALARMGLEVEVLYIATPRELEPEWSRIYDAANVRIRTLERLEEPTEPAFFARMLDVARSLRADEPDVVVVQDLGAPAYVALRLKQLGLAFERTLFVVFCHGTRRWITDVARKTRVLPGALAITMLERASLECADCAVSPSAYLVEWMRAQGWRIPERTVVIPYFTRSGATGEPAGRARASEAPIQRIAFFGRFEERKGIRSFTSGLNLVDPSLLRNVELEFVGVPATPWPPSRVAALLSERTASALVAVSFETDLDQQDALVHLARPGTLAVMPSLEDNSPNTVYECLEQGIPFVASRAGGTPELVAAEDRDRVLFEPTPEGVADALTHALSARGAPVPARPAFDAESTRRGWSDILAATPQTRRQTADNPAVDVVVVGRSAHGSSPCVAALERQRYRPALVTIAADRPTGARAGTSPWVVFLAEDDEPEERFLDTLVRAQQASGADAVTCGVTGAGDPPQRHFFLGDPGGLGVLSNGYGGPALIRRSVLGLLESADVDDEDPDWMLLAQLSLAGATIVSVPMTLVTTMRPPGRLGRNGGASVAVVQEFEAALPRPLESLARLAAGLAEDALSARGERRMGILDRLRARVSRARS